MLLPPPAFAAADAKPSAGSNTVSLSPFLQNITLSPSDSGTSYNLQLSNHSSNVQELDLSAHDFGSLNNTGGVLLEGSQDNYSQKYGLTSWMTLEADTVVLNPGESRIVLVTIDNRQDLTPGGHYGAVVATVKSLDDQSGNHVVINQQLLSLILLDKQGGDHYALNLESIEQNGNWLHLPNTIKLHFQNPGNVHVVPRGQVFLKNPVGKVLAQGIINSDSAYILPDSFRDMYTTLTPVGHSLPLPGLYHVEVDFRYDGITQTAHKNYFVHFINLKLYAALIVAILIFIWLIRRYLRKHKIAPKNATKTNDETE